MNKEELVQAIEALLFVSGKPVDVKTLVEVTKSSKEDVLEAVKVLKQLLIDRNSGIQLIEINSGYQLATLEKFYPQICELMDNRPKPSLSQAALEVLAIIAYNPKVTRAEVERIRGVSSDSAMNKLIEYNLIEEAGRMDAPGRPVMYKTTDEFLRLFGYSSLSDMPDLPKLKNDDGQLEIDVEDANELEETENVESLEQE